MLSYQVPDHPREPFRDGMLFPCPAGTHGNLPAVLLLPESFRHRGKGGSEPALSDLAVQRRTIVTGRYVLSFLLFAAGALLGLAMMPLANLVSFSKWYPGFSWKLALVSFSFLFYGVMSLAMYPLLFKVGYQKGKVWGYLYIFCIFSRENVKKVLTKISL